MWGGAFVRLQPEHKNEQPKCVCVCVCVCVRVCVRGRMGACVTMSVYMRPRLLIGPPSVSFEVYSGGQACEDRSAITGESASVESSHTEQRAPA